VFIFELDGFDFDFLKNRLWKHTKKIPGSKEQWWELDYISLEENLWDEAMNYLTLKHWENEVLYYNQK